MIQRSIVALAAVLFALGGAGCGQGSNPPAASEKSTKDAAATAAGSKAPSDTAATPAPARYVTQHDPDQVYTRADLPQRGSYLKLDLEGIPDPAMDRVVHRLRTEYCTCGCEKDTIDECLINDPVCTTAVTLATQVIREEKLKG